jgi:hypothetical protein
MIIDDIWNAISTTLIRDDRDMPEMVRWELIEYDDISWLPLCEIFCITWDNRSSERPRSMSEVYREILHSTECYILVSWIFVVCLGFLHICLEKCLEIISHITVCSSDHITTHSCIWRWESSTSIVAIGTIIARHDSYLFFGFLQEIQCSCRCYNWNRESISVYKNPLLAHEYYRISKYTHATKRDEEEFFHTLYEIF